ncbi:PhoP regulatory network YrbL family protein [Candidatus Micrarchaeota archaeon]|nr:PhoP regulatory network YrbL family protein [Candidatus Micrarchaeota archaeon]
MRFKIGGLPEQQSRRRLASIGEGRYRKVTFHEDIVEKRHKGFRTKNYGFFHVDYPLGWYIRWKYGSTDLNRMEKDNYNRCFSHSPRRLSDCFAKVLKLEGSGLNSVLHMERVRNADGTPATPLSMNQGKLNPHFWSKFDELINYFKSNKTPLMDLHPDNIMVKNIGEGKSIPVIIDYKLMDGRMFPFQPDTWFNRGAINKMLRKAEKIRREFKESASAQ